MTDELQRDKSVAPHRVVVRSDLPYRHVDGHQLLADLYIPGTEYPPPVVVYVHGGGFRFGSRADGAATRLSAIAAHGVAVLSVSYRLAPDSSFPEALYDVRAAVRWVRGHADELGVDGSRVAVWGSSAGGLLASLVALTAGSDEFEEPQDDPGRLAASAGSSAVQAVVAWFPLTDVEAGASRSALEAAVLPFDFEAALLGVASVAAVAQDPAVAERARRASPVNWASAQAPPFLISHGDRDRITPLSQSRSLHEALVRAGASSTLVVVGGAGHEGSAFESPAHIALTAAWMTATLDSNPL